MSQNKKLITSMVKQPPGGSSGGGRTGGGDGGIGYKFPPISEWKFGYNHSYNGNTLQ